MKLWPAIAKSSPHKEWGRAFKHSARVEPVLTWVFSTLAAVGCVALIALAIYAEVSGALHSGNSLLILFLAAAFVAFGLGTFALTRIVRDPELSFLARFDSKKQ